MALPLVTTIAAGSSSTVTGITSANIRALVDPGIALDLDIDGQSDWREVHAANVSGIWEGGIVGTTLRVRNTGAAAAKVRIVEV